MQEANLLEIAQGLSQLGRVALWLGNEWEAPSADEDVATIVAQDWIGVWAESTDPRLAQEMESAWRDGGRPRQVVQVPNMLEEALGSSFRFADFAPYMYLNGRDGEDDPLDPTTREDSKVDKIRQLGRVQGGLLIVAGVADCADAVNAAILAGRRAPDIRRIVILGHDSSTCTVATEATPDRDDAHVAKMVAYSGGLVELLRDIESLVAPAQEEVVRIGDARVPLVPLLRHEPPITQDYAVLRTSDVSPSPRQGEEPSDLLVELVAGSAQPWRSIARGFVWDKRPERAEWQQLLSDAIQRIRSNKNKVVVLDVDVEPGAGTTVLLSQLAVAAAVDGCPTLFHLAVDIGVAYNRLRTFLTDLFSPGATGGRGNLLSFHPEPVVAPMAENAAALMDDFRLVTEREYRDGEQRDDEVWKAVWARGYENAAKLALLWACSANQENPVIDLPAVEWAIRFADHQIRRQLFLASEHVYGNEFDDLCKQLLRVLREWQVRNGEAWMPFWRVSRKLKWSPKVHVDVRQALIDSREIEFQEVTTGGRPSRQYRLSPSSCAAAREKS
jgi:hypothetical protein